MSEPVTLAQLVAALEQTYKPEQALAWLMNTRALHGSLGNLGSLADAVARIDGCDPRDFTVTERTP